MLPLMKLGNSVSAHQPDEADSRVALLERPHRVDGVPSAGVTLEIADADARTAGNGPGGGKPVQEGRHVLSAFLQRIARRHQPPNLVEAERVHRRKADPPVTDVRRVERPAE